MTSTELKKRIIRKIDKIEDKNLLSQVHSIIDKIISGEKVDWDSLGIKEKRSIEKGLRQLKKSESIEYDEVKKQFAGWLKR